MTTQKPFDFLMYFSLLCFQLLLRFIFPVHLFSRMIKVFLWLPSIIIRDNWKNSYPFSSAVLQKGRVKARSTGSGWEPLLYLSSLSIPTLPEPSRVLSLGFLLLLKHVDLPQGSTKAAKDTFCQIKLFNEEKILKVYKPFVFSAWCFVLFFTAEKEKLELPHRKVTFCVTSFGDGLNRQINLNAVFNLNYLLSPLRRPHLHMKSFPNIFQKLNSCKLKIQPYTWQKDMSAQHKHTFCFCLFSSAKADEIASVILVLTLKETINQIIPNMNRKQCN